MNKKFKVSIVKVLLFFSLALVLGISVYSGNAYAKTIAYIYDTDTDSANDFKSILDSKGYTTSLIYMSNIATTDFSGYDLIIIGKDTGYIEAVGSEWVFHWDYYETVNNLGKPILGLYEGGAYFFEKLNLAIGWMHTWYMGGSKIYAVNPSSLLFSTPDTVTIDPNDVVTLYQQSGAAVDVYLPSPTADITLIGRQETPDPYADPSNHYPIVQQNRYVLWGFDGSPSSMTQDGKNLFTNIINYLLPERPLGALPVSECINLLGSVEKCESGEEFSISVRKDYNGCIMEDSVIWYASLDCIGDPIDPQPVFEDPEEGFVYKSGTTGGCPQAVEATCSSPACVTLTLKSGRKVKVCGD
jgi:hypothetical protein